MIILLCQPWHSVRKSSWKGMLMNHFLRHPVTNRREWVRSLGNRIQPLPSSIYRNVHCSVIIINYTHMESSRRFERQWYQCFHGTMRKKQQSRKKVFKKIRNNNFRKGNAADFLPIWSRVLIRMCWEIIVSLRAIGTFHVYIMHMHGLEQSSETRYPISCGWKGSLSRTCSGL